MTTQSLEELLHDIDGFYFQLQTSGLFPYPQVLKAVKAYATLLETHTPEKIEALLKGEAWIAPRKEPKGWTKEDWFHLQVGIDFHEKRDAYVRHYPTNSNLIR